MLIFHEALIYDTNMLQLFTILLEIILIFFVSADFFLLNEPFRKFLTGIPLECQTVFDRDQAQHLVIPDLSQAVCKGYQQKVIKKMSLAGK